MLKLILVATALVLLSVGAVQAASSACKGLTQSDCTTSAQCRWIAARSVGDVTKAGPPSKTAAKAHCKLGRAARQAAAAADSK